VHIRSLLDRARWLYPDHVAVVQDGAGACTYAELYDRVGRLAGALSRLGVAAHDRVGVVAGNRAAFLELYFACAWIDAVLVPINVRLHAREVHDVLVDAGVVLLACEPAFAVRLDDVLPGSPIKTLLWLGSGSGRVPRPELEEAEYEAAVSGPSLPPGTGRGGDQLAHLYYTSGTTGRAKGVMLTHRNVCTHALMAIAELRLSEADVWAHVAPMFHLADAWAVFAVTAVGGRHVVVPRFEPEPVLAALSRERVTVTNLVPTMLNLMVKHESLPRHDLSGMRLILSGGAPIAPDVVERVAGAFGGEYVQTYGMTETSPFLTMSLLKAAMRGWPAAAQRRMRGKTGRPVLGVELRVVTADGKPVGSDERQVGEIQVRGETVTPGYWCQPAATAAAFTPDGFLRTGDLAVVDAEGFVTIVDRSKDVVITGGENVYSTEVENVLYAHPAVLEAAMFGVPDAVLGERVAAAVVLRAGMTVSAEELLAFCRQHIAAYKVPREIRFLASLPRTGSGKIAKRFLRDGGWPAG